MPCHITPACHTFPQLKYVVVNSRMWYPEQIFCKSGVKLCKGWQTHSMNGRSMLWNDIIHFCNALHLKTKLFVKVINYIPEGMAAGGDLYFPSYICLSFHFQCHSFWNLLSRSDKRWNAKAVEMLIGVWQSLQFYYWGRWSEGIVNAWNVGLKTI